MILNHLSTWLERYLAEQLGEQTGFHYSETTPAPAGTVLVTVGFMPEQPADILTITGYNFLEETNLTGALEAYIQLRGRAATRQQAIAYVNDATAWLQTTTFPRLARVKRTNLQPIGQDQMGLYEVTANLLIETTLTERN